MSYQVIARKYRPQKFSDVVGQEAIVTTLKNSLAQNRTAHAYLFCGSRGTGKTTLARLLAKTLNCDKLSFDLEPCGQCLHCEAIAAGRSLDVLEIDGASNRGIDDIRQINETVAYVSSAGKWKIYIIDEVHMLTKEAFNALLKTLEEPPAKVKFFFATTEPHKIPETIISRCQRFDLARISEEKILHKLISICKDLNRDVDQDALRIIAHRSCGGLRDAESMLDQVLSYAEGKIDAISVTTHLGLPSQHHYFALDQHFEKGNLSFAFSLVEDLFSTGSDPLLFLEGLAEHYRILLMLSYDKKHLDNRTNLWLDATTKQAYTKSATIYTTEQCLFILEQLVDWLQKLGKSPYPRLALEIVLTSILRSRHRVTLDALVQRLILMEKAVKAEAPIAETPKVVNPNPASVNSLEESLSTVLGQIEPPKNTIEPIPDPVREPLQEPSYQPTPPIQEPVAPPVEPAPAPPQAPPNQTSQISVRHETLMQFAAVELEGSLKKTTLNRS